MADFDKIDDLFRQGMGEGKAEVPAGSWQSIQSKLAASASTERNKKAFWPLPVPLIWITAGFIAGTTLTGTSIYIATLKEENQKLTELVGQYKANEQNVRPVYSELNSTLHNVKGRRARQDNFLTLQPNKWERKDNPTNQGEVDVTLNSLNVTKIRSQKSNKSGITTKSKTHANKLSNKRSEQEVNPTTFSEEQQIVSAKVKNDPLLTSNDQIPFLKAQFNSFRADSVQSAPLDSFTVKAKETKEVEKPKDRKTPKLFGFPIAFGMYLGPEIASRSIEFKGEQDPEMLKYKQNDRAKFGFSAGVSLDLELPKHFYFRTGLNYWNLGDKNTVALQNNKSDTSYVVNQVPIPNGLLPDTSSIASGNIKMMNVTSLEIKESFSQFSKTIQNNYHYIGVPMLIGMKLGHSKINAGIYSGFLTNILVSPNKSVYSIYYDPESPDLYVQSERELSRVTFAYWGGVDIAVQVSKNWSLTASPSVKYSLTSLYKDSGSFRQLPYSFGLQLGCRYQFGK